MRSRAYLIIFTLLFGMCVRLGLAQQTGQNLAQPKQTTGNPSSPTTENISDPASARASQPVNALGFMEPAQVKSVVQHIWQAEMRIHDLLKLLHPENWKTSDVTRNSFN